MVTPAMPLVILREVRYREFYGTRIGQKPSQQVAQLRY